MDGAQFVALDGAGIVDRTTQHIHDAAQRARADRHRDRRAGAVNGHAATQTVGRAEGNRADDAVAKLLLDFEGQALFSKRGRLVGQLERFVDMGHLIAGKLNIHHGADALNDGSVAHVCSLLDNCLMGYLVAVLRLHRRGAPHDFRNFFGNCCLAGLVVDQLQIADHFLCVVRRGLHGDHPG